MPLHTAVELGGAGVLCNLIIRGIRGRVGDFGELSELGRAHHVDGVQKEGRRSNSEHIADGEPVSHFAPVLARAMYGCSHLYWSGISSARGILAVMRAFCILGI